MDLLEKGKQICAFFFLIFLTFLIVVHISFIPTDYSFDKDIPLSIYGYAWNIRNQPVEYLYVFNATTGELIYESVGDKDSCSVEFQYAYLLENNIMIHNHPNGIPILSYNDINCFNHYKVKEMWVVTDSMIVSYNEERKTERRCWKNAKMY